MFPKIYVDSCFQRFGWSSPDVFRSLWVALRTGHCQTYSVCIILSNFSQFRSYYGPLLRISRSQSKISVISWWIYRNSHPVHPKPIKPEIRQFRHESQSSAPAPAKKLTQFHVTDPYVLRSTSSSLSFGYHQCQIRHCISPITRGVKAGQMEEVGDIRTPNNVELWSDDI